MADYISRTHYGDVVRRSDGVVVAPVTDDQSPDYLVWAAWCEAGNTPDIDDSWPPEDPVPDVVSPWQIRKALNQLGLREAVEAFVAQQSRDVRDGWEFASEFRFDNELLNVMAPLLGIDLAAVFRLAATL